MPEVDNLETCFVDEGVSSPGPIEEPLVVVPLVRLRLRMVTLEGMWLCPIAESVRGDALGGVLIGAGSFDRADCTRCSSLCIWAVSVRICVRD
jgi:hypothetical protein